MDTVNKYKLTINVKKTKYLLLKAQNNDKLDIIYNKTNIKNVNSYKYLGLNIDKNLNWNLHINEIALKCRKITGIFRRISNYIPNEVKRSIYFSLFHANIKYGLLIWGVSSTQNIKKLQIIQNKAIKNIYNLELRTNSSYMYKKFNIKTIQQQLKITQAEHIYKIRNKLILSNTNFCQGNETHNYNTRCASNLRTLKTGSSNIYNRSIQEFNKIPVELQNTNFKEFKRIISS